jgi:N-acetylneuraminic acid mutarotase
MRHSAILTVLLFIPAWMIGQANTWLPVANFSGGSRVYPVSFSVNNEGYVALGDYNNDCWKFNPAGNTWSQCANFAGTGRFGAVAFVIGNSAYVGTGYDSLDRNDFWKYSPQTNQWTSIADFPGAPRAFAVAFSIGNRGYVGTGVSNWYQNYHADFWQYFPSTDSWSAIQQVPGPRCAASAFVIGNYGYVMAGSDSANCLLDTWKYSPALNSWLTCSNYAWPERGEAFAVAVAGYGYLGCGRSGNIIANSFDRYSASTDTWTNLGGTPAAMYRYGPPAFVCNDTIYMGMGGGNLIDFWKYYPSNAVSTQEIVASAVTISVFPNPGTDHVRLAIEGLNRNEMLVLRIFNVHGKLVREENVEYSGSVYTLLRNDLEAGQYFLEIQSHDRVITRTKILFR